MGKFLNTHGATLAMIAQYILRVLIRNRLPSPQSPPKASYKIIPTKQSRHKGEKIMEKFLSAYGPIVAQKILQAMFPGWPLW